MPSALDAAGSRETGRIGVVPVEVLWWLAGLVLLVAAVAVRVIDLGERQLFRDEAATWLESSYPTLDLVRVAMEQPYPPLYALLIHGWMGLAGDSEAALRFPSVVAGLAVVLIGWRWAHEALGRWPSLVCLTVLALSPVAVANAREARMYALEAAFVTAAWWLTWRLLSGRVEGRARAWHAAILALAVAGELWTMAIGMAAAGSQGLVVVGALVGRIAGARWALIGLVAGGLAFLPWLPALFGVAMNGQPYWTAVPATFDWAVSLGTMLIGWREDLPNFVLLRALLLGLAIGGLLWLLRSRDAARVRLGWCIAAGVSLPLLIWLISQMRSIYDTRYLGAAVGPLAIALAAGGEAIAEGVRRLVAGLRVERRPPGRDPDLLTAAVHGLLAASLAWTMIGPLWTWLDESRRELGLGPTRELMAALVPRLGPGDALLALDARSYFPLAYQVSRLRREGRSLPVVRDWDAGNQPFYRGQSLLPPGVVIDDATLRSRGWSVLMPELGPGGSIWLIAIANGRAQDLDFGPLERGELREVDRIMVEREGGAAQARRLQLTEAP